MKKSKIALRLISLVLTFVLVFSMSGLSVFAADESDYVAEFRIETDKSTVKKGEDVEVSVFLKTNYYISSVSLVVIYNCQVFTLQNTDSGVSFLKFSGQMAEDYRTNGNSKITEKLFASRNSRPAYWSREATLEKYKAVFASWVADASYSYYQTKLSEEEKIVSFTLKANEDAEDLSELVFISLDFQKTATDLQGALFVGRSTSREINLNNIVSTGQAIIYHGVDPTVNEEIEHTPGEVVTENLIPPDCENTGSYDSVVYCTFCGDEISRETIVTDALGHVPGRVEITEATTESEGSKTTYCDVCDEVISVEVIEKIKLSISPSEGKETVIDTENGIIYGLEVGIDSLAGFVTTQGYTLEYTYAYGSFGTGTRVDCVYNDEIKETYYVVIFGDLTGDGVVDIYDASVYAAIVNGDMEFEEDSVFNLASDLNDDTVSDIYDLAIINSVVNGETDLSQILR